MNSWLINWEVCPSFKCDDIKFWKELQLREDRERDLSSYIYELRSFSDSLVVSNVGLSVEKMRENANLKGEA